jgi:hypothetical protein
MMKRKYYLVVVTILGFILTACERDANVDMPDVESKLVVRCFISPNDSDIVVNLTQSDPVYGSSDVSIYDPVLNAQVVISNGVSSSVLTYDPNRQAYVVSQNQFQIESGQQYILTASADGLQQVNAITRVPDAAPLITDYNVYIEDTLVSDYQNEIIVNGDLNWTNGSNDGKYYSIRLSRVEATDLSMEGYLSPILFETLIDDLIEAEESTVSVSKNLRSSYYSYNDFQVADTAFFELYLLNVNEDYYKFNRSIENLTYGDPFSEPSFVYSNISGGLGVFAAYNGVRVSNP